MVFIGWSGDRSKKLAVALRESLKNVFEDLDVWMSESEIEVGSLWIEKLNRALNSSSFGVLCLTPENLNAPWLLFEAGSLAKGASHYARKCWKGFPALPKNTAGWGISRAGIYYRGVVELRASGNDVVCFSLWSYKSPVWISLETHGEQ